MGGGGSGNLNNDARGANRTYLKGNIIAATALFQATGDPVPG